MQNSAYVDIHDNMMNDLQYINGYNRMQGKITYI